VITTRIAAYEGIIFIIIKVMKKTAVIIYSVVAMLVMRNRSMGNGRPAKIIIAPY
jgi:hypothetical protein